MPYRMKNNYEEYYNYSAPSSKLLRTAFSDDRDRSLGNHQNRLFIGKGQNHLIRIQEKRCGCRESNPGYKLGKLMS